MNNKNPIIVMGSTVLVIFLSAVVLVHGQDPTPSPTPQSASVESKVLTEVAAKPTIAA